MIPFAKKLHLIYVLVKTIIDVFEDRKIDDEEQKTVNNLMRKWND